MLIGSTAWLETRQGRLSLADRITLAQQIVGAQMGLAYSVMRHNASPLGKPIRPEQLKKIRLPDTTLAKAAREHCEAHLSEAVLNHSIRTYYWGRLLGDQDGIGYDDESFFVASLFHDAGLAPHCRDAARRLGCFTGAGAEEARRFCDAHQAGRGRQECISEAITLHMNVAVPRTDGAEAHLLHEGAQLDCTAIRAWELHRDTRREICARYPMLDFKTEVDAAFQDEMRDHPHGRTAFLYRYAFFGLFLRNSRICPKDRVLPRKKGA